MKWFMVVCLSLLLHTHFLSAQIGTVFSEPIASTNPYVDTGNPNVAHALNNNPGQMPVNYTFAGGELGFSSYYTPTRNTSIGITDGDLIGINDSPTIFLDEPGTGGWPTAGQGLEIEDPDGLVQITFSEVDLSGTTNPTVSVMFYLSSTGYEESEGSTDYFRIFCRMDYGAFEIDLINTSGQDINDMGIEGSWLTASQVLPAGTIAELIIEADFNSNAEELFIDEVQFSEGVPLPVEFLFFEGSVEEGEIQLNWATASEQNNDYFQIERSRDGKEFHAIGETKGAGNSTKVEYYSFRDHAPDIGFNYYRIKQVDFNGQEEIHKIIVLKFEGPIIELFPNPLSGNILTIDTPENYIPAGHLYLNNVQGQELFSWPREKYQQLNLSLFPDGVYILCSEFGQCQKLIIQRSP